MRPPRYFAYGSNMNPERVRERGLNVRASESATLPGFALRFDKVSRQHPSESHANIVRQPGETVEGVLYELADHDDILRMDRFENTPINYSREAVLARTRDGIRPAWTYFANPAVRSDGLIPSDDYLAHLLAGRDYLSPGYLAQIRRLAGRAE